MTSRIFMLVFDGQICNTWQLTATVKHWSPHWHRCQGWRQRRRRWQRRTCWAAGWWRRGRLPHGHHHHHHHDLPHCHPCDRWSFPQRGPCSYTGDSNNGTLQWMVKHNTVCTLHNDTVICNLTRAGSLYWAAWPRYPHPGLPSLLTFWKMSS